MKFSKLNNSENNAEKKDINLEKKEEKALSINKELAEKEMSKETMSRETDKIEHADEEINLNIERKFSIQKEKKKITEVPYNLEEEIKKGEDSGDIIYLRAINLSKEVLVSSSYMEKYEEIKYLIERLHYEIINNRYFPRFISYVTPSNYIYSHCVNVAILSIGCAIKLNYEKEKIIDIGIAAFLHDLGIMKFMNLIKQERELTEAEKEIVKEHVFKSVEELDKITDFDYSKKKYIADLILKSHERFDGSGYPNSLSGKDVDEESSIIAISDVYEAMTHKRNYRDAFEQPKIMKYFVEEMKHFFHPNASKAIIMFNGMYPINSLVKLSSGEIGRVVFTNNVNLTRPIVEALLSSSGHKIEKFYVNLVEYPLTSIETYMDFSEIIKLNPDFYSEFEMENFYLKWE
jgi:HD-GYP domain-containing protein (c-di-GMP phosphodiesterase class II)